MFKTDLIATLKYDCLLCKFMYAIFCVYDTKINANSIDDMWSDDSSGNNVCCSEVCDLVMKDAMLVKVADSFDGNCLLCWCLCCSEHSESLCCVLFDVYIYIHKHIHICLCI